MSARSVAMRLLRLNPRRYAARFVDYDAVVSSAVFQQGLVLMEALGLPWGSGLAAVAFDGEGDPGPDGSGAGVWRGFCVRAIDDLETQVLAAQAAAPTKEVIVTFAGTWPAAMTITVTTTV